MFAFSVWCVRLLVQGIMYTSCYLTHYVSSILSGPLFSFKLWVMKYYEVFMHSCYTSVIIVGPSEGLLVSLHLGRLPDTLPFSSETPREVS